MAAPAAVLAVAKGAALGGGLGGVVGASRQGYQMLDDPSREFSWGEVVTAVKFGAVIGGGIAGGGLLLPYAPASVAAGLKALGVGFGAGAGVGSATHEFAHGNIATGAFDLLLTGTGTVLGAKELSGGRAGIGGAGSGKGVPLQPGGAAVRPAGQVAPVIATGERVPLWRAVENPELVDIVARRAFRIPPGGIEGKIFSLTPEGAAQYARMASRTSWGRPPYTLVETTGPRGIIGGVKYVDRGVPEVVIAGRDLGALSPPQVLDYMPIPPR
jgi:hypothetical protein